MSSNSNEEEQSGTGDDNRSSTIMMAPGEGKTLQRNVRGMQKLNS